MNGFPLEGVKKRRVSFVTTPLLLLHHQHKAEEATEHEIVLANTEFRIHTWVKPNTKQI